MCSVQHFRGHCGEEGMVWLCRSQYRGREAEQRGQWQEEATARHSAQTLLSEMGT